MKPNTLLLGIFLLLALTGCGSAPQRPAAVVEGERLLARGVMAYRNDELLEAATFFTKALSHYQGLDSAEGQLQSRINLVEVALAVGNLDAAQRHLEQAELLAADERVSYRPRLALLHSSLALARGDMALARTLSESLLPPQQGGSAPPPAVDAAIQREALINRTSVAFALGGEEPATWTGRLEKGINGDGASQAAARLERFRAALALRGGDHASASLHLQQALELCKALPSRRCIAATLEEWGAQLQASGALTEAEDRYQRALAVRLALLDRGGSSNNLRQLAEICRTTGRDERAATLAGWADQVATGKTIDWGRLRGDTLPH
ncbi:MAG TPA: hypothetical protein VGE50_07195 [Gammaproteobacteria bacterium]